MAKKLLVFAVAIVVVAVAVVFFVDFESPELGNAVVEKAREATGARFSVKRFRLNLIRGLELEGVEVTSSFPGTLVDTRIDELVLRHRLLPLLSGRVAVDQLLITRPKIVLVERNAASKKKMAKGTKAKKKLEGGPSSANGAGGERASEERVLGLDLEISEIRIEDGSIRKDFISSFSVDGLDLTLHDLTFNRRALSLLHAITAVGSLALDGLVLDETEIREVRGELTLDNGLLEGKDFSFITEQGTFHARLKIDFNRIPFGYTLSLRGDPIDVNAIARAREGGFGAGVLELEAEGFGAGSKGIKGTGVLRLDEGRLPSTPVLAGLEELLGRGTALVGSRYGATDVPFRIEKNQLILERFRLETPQVGLDIEGIVHLDGPLALSLVLRTPREGLVIKEVPGEVLDALTDDEGWVAIPFRITGTRDKPKVLPDAKSLLTGSGTQKLIERGIKGLFDKKL
jgi:hypothetical protein